MKHDYIYLPFPRQTASMTPHHAVLPILCLFFVNNPQNPITATHMCMSVWRMGNLPVVIASKRMVAPPPAATQCQ